MAKGAYIYAVRVDGIVRYVGKGTGTSFTRHIKIVRSMARRRAAGETVLAESVFYEKLCKAYLNGSVIDHEVLLDGMTNEDAFKKVTDFWSSYPAGQLWNSPKAWDRPEFRQKQMARWSDPEIKQYHRDRVAAVQQRPENVQFHQRKMKDTWNSPDGRTKMMAGLHAYRTSVFENTIIGKVYRLICDNPGLTFTALKSSFPEHQKAVAISLKRLRNRGLIEKGYGKFGGYIQTNVTEIYRSVS